MRTDANGLLKVAFNPCYASSEAIELSIVKATKGSSKGNESMAEMALVYD